MPYTALVMSLSSNPTDRDSAIMYRMMFEVAGAILGAIGQGEPSTLAVGEGLPIAIRTGERDRETERQREGDL